MKRIIGFAARCCVGLAIGCGLAAVAVAAPPPETLQLNDLAARPDRWPAQVTIKRDMDFGNAKLAAGQKVAVLEYNGGSDMGVDAGNNQLFGISTDDCDLLDAANSQWAKLSPEQRALEPKTVIEDASLWPAKVKCTSEFVLDAGKVIPAGQEYELMSIDSRGGVTLWATADKAKLSAKLAQTDAVARARELVAVDPAKRPARVAAALRDVMVDSEGATVKKENLDEQTVYALYYGASWCGPCRSFSPGFVKYVESVAAANPKLTVVLVSNDEKDADMLKYMKDEKMPWAAVPLKAMNDSPVLMSYLRGSIPQLTIVDRYGKIIADSWSADRYVGPNAAMAGLDKTLKSGAAK